MLMLGVFIAHKGMKSLVRPSPIRYKNRGDTVPSLNKVLRSYTIGPLAQALFPTHVIGRENLPAKGPYVIAAGPHRSELESVLLASALPDLEQHFFAKEAYWGSPFGRWFMSGIKAIPVNRNDSRAAVRQIAKGVDVLVDGGIVTFYPEGTRGNDDSVHRGRTGVIRMALDASKKLERAIPVVAVGMIGMRDLNPPGETFLGLPKLKPGRNMIVIGTPMLIGHNAGETMSRSVELATRVIESDSVLARPITTGYVRNRIDHLMHYIAELSASNYSNEYLETGAAGTKR